MKINWLEDGNAYNLILKQPLPLIVDSLDFCGERIVNIICSDFISITAFL